MKKILQFLLTFILFITVTVLIGYTQKINAATPTPRPADCSCSIPNSLTCIGNDKYKCSDGCYWNFQETCPEICHDGLCQSPTTSPRPTNCSCSVPNSVTCMGNDKYKCRDGCYWNFEETCSGGCSNGACDQVTPGPTSGDDDGEFIVDPDTFKVTKETLESFDPLKTEKSPYAEELSTPRGILGRFFQFAFPIAGMILFVLIVWGGFTMMTGAASKKSLDSGKQMITAAVVGFLLLFISYWLAQIIESVFGIDIFGN